MIEPEKNSFSVKKQQQSILDSLLDQILVKKRDNFRNSIRLSELYEYRVKKRKLNMTLLQKTQKTLKCQRIINRFLQIKAQSDLIPCVQQIYQVCSSEEQKIYHEFDLRVLNKLLQIARESQQIESRTFFISNRKMMLKRKILEIVTNYFSKVEKAILPVQLISYLIQELSSNQNQTINSVVLICIGNIAHFKEIKSYLFQNDIMDLLIKLKLNKGCLDDLSFMLINLVNDIQILYRKQFLKILQHLQNLFLNHLDETSYLQDFMIILKQLYKTQNKQFQIDLINLNKDFLVKVIKYWKNSKIEFSIFEYFIELLEEIFNSHIFTDKIYMIEIVETLLEAYQRFKQKHQIKIWKIVNKYLSNDKGSAILKFEKIFSIIKTKIQNINQITCKQYQFELIKIILNISIRQYLAPYNHKNIIQIIVKKLPDSYEPYTEFLLKKLHYFLNQNKQENCKYFLEIGGFSIINKICLYDEENSSQNTAACIMFDFRDYLGFDKLDQMNDIELEEQMND